MKKLLIAILTVVILASCSNEETLVVAQPDVIGFGDVFVKNTTRAALDSSFGPANPMESFNVWGKVTGNVGNTLLIYKGALVERNGAEDGSAFKCEQTEYWIPSATYDFMAIYGATDVEQEGDDLPTAIIYNVDGTTDLLLSERPVSVTTNNMAEPTGLTNQCVAFTFEHLLSKVKFVVNVAPMASSYSYRVKNISIKSVADGGVYTIDAETPWDPNETTRDLSFGNIVETSSASGADPVALYSGSQGKESNWSRLLVPGEVKNIYFLVDLWKGDSFLSQEEYNIELEDEKIINLQAGCAYNFTINLAAPGTPIDFSATEVDNWEDKPITVQ